MSEPRVNPPLGPIAGRVGGYLMPSGAAAAEMWNPEAITSTAQGILQTLESRLVRRDSAPPEGFKQMLQGFDVIPGMRPGDPVGSLLHAESESSVNEIVRLSNNLVTFTARLGELDVSLPIPQPREFYCLVSEDMRMQPGALAELPADRDVGAIQMLAALPRAFLARLNDGALGRVGAIMPVSRQCGLGLAAVNYWTLLYEKYLYETAPPDKGAFKNECALLRTPLRHLALFPPHGVIFEEDMPQPRPGSQLPAESYGGLQMQRSSIRGPTTTTIVKGRVTMLDYTNDRGTYEGNGVYLLARRHKYKAGKTYKFNLILDGARGAPVSAGEFSITIPQGDDLYPVQYHIIHSADHRLDLSLPHCEWGPHKCYNTTCFDAVSVPLGCVVQHNQTTLTASVSSKAPQTPHSLNEPIRDLSIISKTYPTVVQLDMSASVTAV